MERVTKALDERYPAHLEPPWRAAQKIEEPSEPVIVETLKEREAREVALLPPRVVNPKIDAMQEARVVMFRERRLARANAPLKINNRSVPMATFTGGDIPFDNRKGQQAPFGINFVPFIALTKWCYTYAPKHLLQPLATAFFDADKIYARDWDL